MAKALLHVEDQIYCELDIEDSPMPSTPNFVDKIHIVEGFGQATPVLRMILSDQTGSLSDDLSLMEGKKITLKLGKSASQNEKREFRVFGFSNQDTHEGQKIDVVCVLDSYKYFAEAFTKAFKGTSADAMARVAGLSGLKYDGPNSTNDFMTWLNVCQTYSSFTEDVATHGYAGSRSCMYRCVTSKKKLLYKDLFQKLSESEVATLLHNVQPSNSNNEFIIREARPVSRGGIVSHWLNYGYAQHEHDLSGENTSNLKITAPISKGFPVNKIRDDMEYSKIDYVGLDTGTTAKSGGNVHKNYRKASYQNLRFYSLFTDGLTCLLEQYTDLEIMSPIKVNFVDLKRGEFVQNERYSGKYIITNKTTTIKNGIRYSEKITLGRPSVGNAQ